MDIVKWSCGLWAVEERASNFVLGGVPASKARLTKSRVSSFVMDIVKWFCGLWAVEERASNFVLGARQRGSRTCCAVGRQTGTTDSLGWLAERSLSIPTTRLQAQFAGWAASEAAAHSIPCAEGHRQPRPSSSRSSKSRVFDLRWYHIVYKYIVISNLLFTSFGLFIEL